MAVQHKPVRKASPSPALLLVAELLLARDAIVVAVHLHSRTISEKGFGFITGRHLRTVLPAIAAEVLLAGCRGKLSIRGLCRWFELWRAVLPVPVVAECNQGAAECNRYKCAHRRILTKRYIRGEYFSAGSARDAD